MTLDPRTPIVVGVGQYKQQLTEFSGALEQYELMVEALRLAGADAGASALLGAIDQLMVIGGLWRYPDPGRLVADAVGATAAKTLLTYMGGNLPQTCVSDAAARILAGEVDVVAVCGGEAVYSKNKLRQLGLDLPRSGLDLAPAARFGEDVQMASEHEHERGFITPPEVYALFESAIRAHRGESMVEHQTRLGELWEAFNRVAVANPHAWVRTPMTAEEIVTASASNRMVGSPYTKAMNANSFVDFGSAVIVTSVQKAERLGIPRDKWVFPHSGTEGSATHLFSERDNYHSSPAINHTGKRCLELASVDIDDVAHMDLYSCFPSVVQLTMTELGISADRTVTTTGGLPFFGGPMNCYVLHAIASTIDALRSDPGSHGFVHANGGFATKHACGVYSSEPPPRPFRRLDVQADINQHPTRAVDEAPEGPGTVETFTVMHSREGPAYARVTALMPDGRRALASSTEPDLMADMLREDVVGRDAILTPSGEITVR